ncbi:TonB-dependent receptor [Sphingomonas sp. CJ20]
MPVAITAFSEKGLEQRGIVKFEDLRQSIPSFQLTPVSGRESSLRPTLRSQSQLDTVVTQDGAVGTYVDEVYQGRAAGLGGALVDVQSVQALKGPQGTLFGKNTTGGAVVITSARPSTDAISGYARAYVGNYEAYGVQGALNVPLSDNAAIRIAGSRDKRDGYVYNAVSGKNGGNRDDYSLRGSLLLRIGPSIENVLVGSYYESNARSPTAYLRAIAIPGSLAESLGFGPALQQAYDQQRTNGRFKAANDVYGPSYAENSAVTNITTIELGGVTLKNIVGYRHLRARDLGDLDATALPIISTDQLVNVKQFSEEMILSGKAFADRLSWTAGGIFFREYGSDFTNTVIGPDLIRQHSGAENAVNRSIGLFAQGEYKLTKTLSLTLGGRYTWDRRSVAVAPTSNAPLFVLTGQAPGPDNLARVTVCPVTGPAPSGTGRAGYALSDCHFSDSADFSKPSYTVGLNWQAAPDNLLYIAHRRSYRTGGFNQRLSTIEELRRPFAPETVKDLEIGSKNTFHMQGAGVLRLNVAAYYVRYDNIQRLVSTLRNNNIFNTIVNAASATIKGVEVDTEWRPVPSLSLSAGYSYSKPSYQSFVAAGVGGVVTDLSANRFANAPEHSGTAAIRFQPETNWSFGRPVLGIDGYAQTSTESLDINAIGSKLSGYALVNASLGLEQIGGKQLSLTVAVRNLFDRQYDIGALALTPPSRSAGPNSIGTALGLPGAPRTVLATLRFDF